MNDMQKTKWQLGQLDALRGIAVLGVLLVHSLSFPVPGNLHPSEHLSNIVLAGQRGVQLFYLLSAFTLAMSQDRRRSEHRPLGNFFLRRFFRIAPMFYVAMLLTYLLQHEYSGTRTAHILAATFINGFHPVYIGLGAVGGWSVADEAIFYALLPALLLCVRSVRSAAVTLVLVSIVSKGVISFVMHRWPAYPEYWRFSSMVAELPVFLFGLLLYYTWKDVSQHSASHKPLSICMLTVSALLFFTLLPISNEFLLPESLTLALFLFSLLLHPWHLFVNRATIFLGKISFSVYLLHFYVYFRIQPLLRPLEGRIGTGAVLALTVLCGLVLVVPVATLSWLLIEKPGIALGAKLIDRLEHRRRSSEPTVPLKSAADTPEAQF